MKRKKEPFIKDPSLRKKLALCDTIDFSTNLSQETKKRRSSKQPSLQVNERSKQIDC